MPTLASLRNRNVRTARAVPSPRLLPAPVVDCAVYVHGRRLPGRLTRTEAMAEVRERGEGFVRIGLHEPRQPQIQGIAEALSTPLLRRPARSSIPVR